ncbi:hypothetical protein BJ742DRAFT_801096 [Cladochytrium replicatum]|nr:hypothetical protein BJ742DRAFT_801096 [Cladochytrium replicatum]
MLHRVPVASVSTGVAISSCALHYQQDAGQTLSYRACSLSANVAHPGRADNFQSATWLQSQKRSLLCFNSATVLNRPCFTERDSEDLASPACAFCWKVFSKLQKISGFVAVVLDSILVVFSNGLSPLFREQKQLSILPCHFWRRSRRYMLAHEGIKTVKVRTFGIELLLPSIQAFLAVLIRNPVACLLRDFHAFFVLPFVFFNFRFHLSVGVCMVHVAASAMSAFLVRPVHFGRYANVCSGVLVLSIP